MKKIRITLMKSLIGEKEKTRETVSSLGLKKINSQTVREVDDSLLGMIRKINHLVHIEEIEKT
ncbi:MAG: 50S ribosomal protein L30 [Candidatus Actinomarinales bacterium]|nr:MAG: 50S ribosomal protein L30 [Candidatus Actinomarinales bacterium]|tara:strand:+ start:609 stop:797 length:189 start_codon:yes stop_codon:yes gene_type:complete